MNRDEILEKSRREYENEDEMEKMVKLRAATVSRSVGFLLCSLMALLDAIFGDFKIVAPVCWTVYWGMEASEGWFMLIKLHQKRVWMMAVLYTAFFLLFAAILVRNVFFDK